MYPVLPIDNISLMAPSPRPPSRREGGDERFFAGDCRPRPPCQCARRILHPVSTVGFRRNRRGCKGPQAPCKKLKFAPFPPGRGSGGWGKNGYTSHGTMQYIKGNADLFGGTSSAHLFPPASCVTVHLPPAVRSLFRRRAGRGAPRRRFCYFG